MVHNHFNSVIIQLYDQISVKIEQTDLVVLSEDGSLRSLLLVFGVDQKSVVNGLHGDLFWLVLSDVKSSKKQYVKVRVIIT